MQRQSGPCQQTGQANSDDELKDIELNLPPRVLTKEEKHQRNLKKKRDERTKKRLDDGEANDRY